MPDLVAVTLPPIPGNYRTSYNSPRVTISDGVAAVVLPATSPETKFDDLTRDRPERQRPWPYRPQGLPGHRKRATMALTAHIWAMKPDGSVNDDDNYSCGDMMNALRSIGNSDRPLTVYYSDTPLERRFWFMESLGFDIKRRDPKFNRPLWAEAAMTFKEAGELNEVGMPIYGRDFNRRNSPGTRDAAVDPLSRTGMTYRWHLLQPGDTLFGIALIYLGDGNRWGEIADLNGIQIPAVGPPSGMTPGTRLTIPGI